MQNIIRIKKAVFYGYHGVLSQEQSVGGKFEADVEMHTDFSTAAAQDNLQKTIDYEAIYKFINKISVEQKYYLIEALAVKIADGLLENFPKISKVAVKVSKHNPPVGGVVDTVEVEVIKDRSEL